MITSSAIYRHISILRICYLFNMTQPEVSPHVDKIDGAARESGETRNRVSDVILTVLSLKIKRRSSGDQAALIQLRLKMFGRCAVHGGAIVALAVPRSSGSSGGSSGCSSGCVLR